MKLIVLSAKKSFEVNCFIQAAKKKDIKTELIKYQDISLNSKTKSTQISQKITNADFIINKASEDPHQLPLQIREALFKTIPEFKNKLLNGDTYHDFPVFSKLIQTIVFATNDIPTPPTTYNKSNLTDQLPVVAKGLFGNNGSTVKLIKTRKQLEALFNRPTSLNPLLQKALPLGEDYRVTVLGNKIINMYKKISPDGKFLTNITAGGKSVKVEESRKKELSALALKTARVFNCEYGGVDIMYDSNRKPQVLEINRAPGFSTSGITQAETVIDYLLEKHQ